MPSGGGSLFACFVAQVPDSIAVIDLVLPAPPLRSELPVLIKATVSAQVAWERHCASFQPDLRILLLRNPADVWQSLSAKFYRDFHGTRVEKLRTLERVYSRRAELFDLVITYEQFIQEPESAASELRRAGIELPADAQRFPRGPTQIAEFAAAHCDWCREHYLREWSFGNVHFMEWGKLRRIEYPPLSCEATDLIVSACPTVATRYGITSSIAPSSK